MSKKDENTKKKQQNNGSKKGAPIELMTASDPRDQKIVIDKKSYEKELARLQKELIKLQEWIRDKNLKVVVIF